jgi:hypothetical protein|uniref:Uncharacterized protein n=1 Tax=viral metagenome TaxID=1070528 RepID=A0A6C0J214_9ZZZZ
MTPTILIALAALAALVIFYLLPYTKENFENENVVNLKTGLDQLQNLKSQLENLEQDISNLSPNLLNLEEHKEVLGNLATNINTVSTTMLTNMKNIETQVLTNFNA